MSDTQLPRTPAEVTPSWLSRALKDAGAIQGSEVTGVAAETIAVGEGFAGNLARLELEYDQPVDGAPGSLIAKFPSLHAPTRSLLSRLGVYEREVRFYRELAPGLALRTPRPYFAAWIAEGQQSLLLLEDLSHLRSQDQLSGCSVADAELSIVELARFHAAFWESTRLAELDWAPPWDRGAEFFQQVYPVLRGQLLQRTSEDLPPGIREVGEVIGSHIVAIKRRLAQPPSTLAHGDFRLDNLFFDDSDSDARIVAFDWQGLRVGRGAYDLAYFLATSLTSEMRRDRGDSLISLYHDTLSASGVTGYTVQECHEDYGYALLDLVSFVTLLGSTLDFDSQRGARLATAINARLADALAEIDTDRLLAALP
jgi:hypothetical protein